MRKGEEKNGSGGNEKEEREQLRGRRKKRN
jgi:hypothetical protein